MIRSAILVVTALVLPLPGLAFAHAFPKNSLPHVGAGIKQSPPQVKIWFDADLEPLFDKLVVKNAHGKVISRGKARVDAHNPALLEVDLPPALPSGQYHVYWRVTARDGHHTQGDFTFTVLPSG